MSIWSHCYSDCYLQSEETAIALNVHFNLGKTSISTYLVCGSTQVKIRCPVPVEFCHD